MKRLKYMIFPLCFLLMLPVAAASQGDTGGSLTQLPLPPLLPIDDGTSGDPVALSSPVNGTLSRVKDIAKVLGVRSNQLWGVGLVGGLNNTGDDANRVPYTGQAIANMLNKAGISVNVKDIKVKNFAAVMVTADLPPFVRPGDTIDVTVSSIGNAKSLEGGTLIMTPLKAANGEIYAVAQGAVSLGGYSATAGGGGAGGETRKGFLTVGRVPNGAIVEKDVNFSLDDGGYITIVLNQPDFTTAVALSDAIANIQGVQYSKAIDMASVEVRIPNEFYDDLVRFISDIENLRIPVDTPAKVVINERTGTIVMGQNVQILPVAIAHGPLTITIKEYYDVSQPPPVSSGFPVAVPGAEATAEEGQAVFVRISTEDIVKALNALGVKPSDIVAIFQALKAAGALQADLEII